MTLGDILGIIGLVITILGFYLAIKQLQKTATATEATRDAIVAANKRMLLNHLLVLAPQLVVIEADMDAAVAIGNEDGAIRSLVAFSHAAVQISALLEAQSEDNHSALVAELRSAATNSTAAKSAIVSGSPKPLKLLLKNVLGEVASTSAKCSALTTIYQIKVA